MARLPEHLLDPRSYSHGVEIPTRFDDIDSMGHVNNVAMAAIFQEGRVRFAHDLLEGMADQNISTFIVSANLEFLDQTYYPTPITLHMAVEKIGGASKTLVQLAVQDGRAKAFCRAVEVYVTDGRAFEIPANWRAKLGALRLRAL